MESIAEARAGTAEVQRALENTKASAEVELAEARAAMAVTEREMAEELGRMTEVSAGLRLELSQKAEEANTLREALEHAEGSLAAVKLDLGILDRKHRRAVESMLEFREQAVGLEHKLDEALGREEAAAAAAAAVAMKAGAHHHPCDRSDSCLRPHLASSRCSSACEEDDPVSITLRFGSYGESSSSDGEDSQVATTSTSEGGESTASLMGP